MAIPLSRYRALLAAYLLPQWPRALMLLALLLGGIGLELLNPQILGGFIDAASQGAPAAALVRSALLFFGVALLTQLAAVAEAYVAENVSLTATNRLRADLMLHCLRLDPSFHSAHTPGELIERVDGDVSTLGGFFSRFVVQLLGNALLLVGVLALLFTIDWRVGAALSVFTALAFVALNRTRNLAVPHWDAQRQADAAMFGFLEERLSGTEDLRSSGATENTLRQLAERSRAMLHRTRHAFLMGSASWTGADLLFVIGTAIALALGAWLFAGGATIGTVYLIYRYTELLGRPVTEISRHVGELQQATASIGRIQQLFDTRSTIADGPGAAFPPGALSVSFEAVSFSYAEARTEVKGLRTELATAAPNAMLSQQTLGLQSSALSPEIPQSSLLSTGYVLNNVSFSLAPGKVLGLLGRTGSGKTTITRLLFRLYDPQGGAIRLGGVALPQATLADLRGRIGIVTQDIQLFSASVRDNLTMFDPTISDARIAAALAELGMGEWLRTLPAGLDTVMPPGGGGISAGEAQLLAFARVFLRDPQLVILDEASSRLDPATERLLERAVDRLLAGRTAIIIAHRLSTVQRADAILILSDGQIQEWGERAALARDPQSRFAQLLRTGLEEVLA